MAKIGRNELCPCDSGKKYKKCCLYRGIEITSGGKTITETKEVIVKTLTDELFQPMRLYYTIHNKAKLIKHFGMVQTD